MRWDDPQTLRYVRDALTEAGYAVVVTGDPEEARGLMEQNKPHLALLDLTLTGTDGIELMQGIVDIADVPVIFLSGYGRDDTIARAFDMGADGYIVKPFSPTELRARNPSGPAPSGGAGTGRTYRTLRPGRSDHRLCRTARDRRRKSGAADGHRV